MFNLDKLVYWIKTREGIRIAKDEGLPKPWSTDPVFQTTYFCNVKRENDKVTKWIRKEYSPHVNEPAFLGNIVLTRFLNWPDTLEELGWLPSLNTPHIEHTLKRRRDRGDKVWGAAYVVTTHGLKMDKIDYLCHNVVPSIIGFQRIEALGLEPTCANYAKGLMGIEGISTFMAGQVVADLKNTPGHPLFEDASDWWTFALPGPGSRRGMDWLMGEHIPESQWYGNLKALQEMLAENYKITLCCQDIQNCLCEFDKYMRVKNGTGRSKRRYEGT